MVPIRNALGPMAGRDHRAALEGISSGVLAEGVSGQFDYLSRDSTFCEV